MFVPVVIGVGHKDHEVVEPALEPLDQVGRDGAVQVEAHLGIAPAELGDLPCNLPHGDALAGADVDVARNDPFVVREVRGGLIGEPDNLLSAPPQVQALFGGRNAAAVALEQLTAQFALELSDLSRQRGLGHM